jgi:hypothetical protein
MNLLIKFPTRARPDLFFSTLDLYYEKAFFDDKIQFLVSIDSDDLTMNNEYIKSRLKDYKNLIYVCGESKSKIDAVNRDMEKAEAYDIILLASDDMLPEIEGYDEVIRDNMQKYYPNTDGILFFNDGYRGKVLNTLCILGRKYYERFGYIYYPGYKSLFADNEFMDVGYLLNKQTYIDDVIIKHEHPENGFPMIRDQIHELNDKNYEFDKQLFISRKKNRFEL